MFNLRHIGRQNIYRHIIKTTNTIAEQPRTTNLSPRTINLTLVRHLGYTQVDTDTHFLHLTELHQSGASMTTSYTLSELTTLLKNDGFNLRLPPRDLKIFFRTELQSKTGNSVLVRPDSNWFTFEDASWIINEFPHFRH